MRLLPGSNQIQMTSLTLAELTIEPTTMRYLMSSELSTTLPRQHALDVALTQFTDY